MGRQAVTAAVRHLRGEPVEPVIDTGAAVVTRDNVDSPAIQKILQLP
jgi:ABC-type sugar transport system substrate-binding protein